MPRRIIAIVNPISGAQTRLDLVRTVARKVERAGGAMRIEITDHPGHATQIAAGLNSAADVVLSAGGDGTISEVINGLQDRPVPILVIPTGTENLLARVLGMPRKADDIAAALLYGRAFRYDVGVVNGRRFLSVVGVGFDAECVARLAQTRAGHITHRDYFLPIWRTFWSYQFPAITVEADGAEIFSGRGLAFVGVMSRYAAGLRILKYARFDDGLLDVCVFPCATRRRLLLHAAAVTARLHACVGGVVYRKARSVRIHSTETIPIEIDGEMGGVLPADFTVLPGAARFLRANESKVCGAGDIADRSPGTAHSVE